MKKIVLFSACALALLFVSCSGKKEAKAGSSSGSVSKASATKNLQPNPESDFAYDMSDDGTGVKITKYLAMESYKCSKTPTIVIPDTIEGLPVVEIGDEVFLYVRSNIESSVQIKLSSGKIVNVKKPLSYVYVPRTVKVVGFEAFKGETVWDVNNKAYSLGIECLDIDLSVLEEVKGNAFDFVNFKNPDITYKASWVRKYDHDNDGIEFYVEEQFHGSNVKSVTFEDGIKNIPNYAFSECPSLETIKIPASVKAIGPAVFKSCTSLKNVEIAEGANIIYHTLYSEEPNEGANTFLGCTALPLAAKSAIKNSGYISTF